MLEKQQGSKVARKKPYCGSYSGHSDIFQPLCGQYSVTALTWIGWFPFLLFDTDWMGREIYGGEPNEGLNYGSGVRMGALGLLLDSVVLGITSLFLERLCRNRGPGFVWGISNIIMAICFVAMLVVTYVATLVI